MLSRSKNKDKLCSKLEGAKETCKKTCDNCPSAPVAAPVQPPVQPPVQLPSGGSESGDGVCCPDDFFGFRAIDGCTKRYWCSYGSPFAYIQDMEGWVQDVKNQAVVRPEDLEECIEDDWEICLTKNPVRG